MRQILTLLQIIGALFALSGPIAAGAGVWWWEHRPHGTPQIKVWFWRWSPPDSLKAKLDADEAELKTDRQNVATLGAAVAAQNRTVDALKAKSAADTAAAQRAVLAASAAVSAADTKAQRILAAQSGADGCKAADDLILQSLGDAP